MTKEAILLGILLGLIFSWKNKVFLSMPSFKNLMISAIGALAFLVSLNVATTSIKMATVFPWIHSISLYVIAIGALIGRHPGYKIAGIGLFLNAIVVSLNGAMPVEGASLLKIGDQKTLALLTEGRTLTHSLANVHTRLRVLDDWIAFSSPITTPRIMSLGDLFIAVGLFFFVASAVSYIFRRTNLYEMDQ